MEKLQWLFELVDKVSAPSKKMSGALGVLGKAFGNSLNGGKVGQLLARLPPRFHAAAFKMAGALSSPLGASMAKALGGAGMAGLRAAGSVASSVFSSIGSGLGYVAIAAGAAAVGLAAVGGKWALETLAFKENADIAFQTILKSKEAADRVMKNAVKFAAVTPFETKDTIANYQRLLVAGFKENELNTVMAGAGDLGAAFGTEKTDQVIGAFQKIMAQGKLTGEATQMLADAGVNIGLVYADLGKTFGTTAKGAQALISAGKIDSRSGIVASLNVIRETISGGELGGMMEKQSKTLSGIWSSLTSKPFELLISADAAGATGSLKAFLTRVSDALDPESTTGKRIIRMFDSIGLALDRMFGKMNGDDFEVKFNKVLHVVERVTEAILWLAGTALPYVASAFETGLSWIDKAVGTDKFLVGLKVLGAALSLIAIVLGAVAVVGAIVLGVFALLVLLPFVIAAGLIWLVAKLYEVETKLETAGKSIVDGLWRGIKDGWGAMLAKFEGLVSMLPASVRGVLGIASPSRVFAELGLFTGQGFNQGLESADMRGAMNDNARPPDFAPMGAMSASSGQSVAMGGVTVQVTVTAAPSQNPDAVGQQIADAVEERLAAILGRMALATGT